MDPQEAFLINFFLTTSGSMYSESDNAQKVSAYADLFNKSTFCNYRQKNDKIAITDDNDSKNAYMRTNATIKWPVIALTVCVLYW